MTAHRNAFFPAGGAPARPIPLGEQPGREKKFRVTEVFCNRAVSGVWNRPKKRFGGHFSRGA